MLPNLPKIDFAGTTATAAKLPHDPDGVPTPPVEPPVEPRMPTMHPPPGAVGRVPGKVLDMKHMREVRSEYLGGLPTVPRVFSEEDLELRYRELLGVARLTCEPSTQQV